MARHDPTSPIVLLHKKILLPLSLDATSKLSQERNVIRAEGFASQWHIGLFRRPIPLLVITLYAGSYQVLPRIIPSSRLRYDVVNCQRRLPRAAIATLVVISTNDILSGKFNFSEWQANVDKESDNAWVGIDLRNCPQSSS